MITRRLFTVAILACSFGLSASAASAASSPLAGPSELGGANAARVFANCTALNKAYPHGVARKGARDRVSGSSRPVTNFATNAAVYNANTKSDRDRDGIACEKR